MASIWFQLVIAIQFYTAYVLPGVLIVMTHCLFVYIAHFVHDSITYKRTAVRSEEKLEQENSQSTEEGKGSI